MNSVSVLHINLFCFYKSFFHKVKCSSSLFNLLRVQLMAGQHSISRQVWTMMVILLPLPQLMQLQQMELHLGIGEKPPKMVSQLNWSVVVKFAQLASGWCFYASNVFYFKDHTPIFTFLVQMWVWCEHCLWLIYLNSLPLGRWGESIIWRESHSSNLGWLY